MSNRIWQIILVVSLIIVVVSGVNVFRLSREYQKGINEYENLEQYASLEEDEAAQGDQNAQETEEQESQIPVSVDVNYDELKKINEDFTLGILIGKPEAKRKQNSGVNKKEKVPTKEERIRFVRKKIDKWVKDATNV